MIDFTKPLESINVPADWVGLRALQERTTTRSMRDGLPTHNNQSLHRGVMVEVIAKGQLGYAAVNSFDPLLIHQAIQDAYQQAIAAQPWQIQTITPAIRPAVQGQYRTVKSPTAPLSPSDVNGILADVCQWMQLSDQIVQAIATAVTVDKQSWFVSTNGANLEQTTSLIELHYAATAQDGAVVQRRSNHGYLAQSYQGGWEWFPMQDLEGRSHQVASQAMELLTAAECPTESTTLVLSPDQMMLQIHESVGHPLELDRILGDERNYAGGSFVKPEDFGSLVYGSPLMNITFDPTVTGEFASYHFDDTGASADRQYLIRQGVLERGLGSLESQTRLGVPGVACARASSWNRPPIDRMANINLEPGTDSLSDLLASVERGVWMETNRSWSIDDQRYKFQFGCEYARLIEQGRLTKPLRNPNYRATTPQFWHNLARVGDRSTWEFFGTPFCGKGEPNQIIRVGHASPVCVFTNIEVFGGVA
jgi:predicted Zn-dependent protease